MFTVTDEDRKLREEGEWWRASCELGLIQDAHHDPLKTYDTREEEILKSSLQTILRERTALLRLIYRQGRERNGNPVVAVTVSHQSVVKAMSSTRMTVMSEQNVRKLIYRYISEEFVISDLRINFQGGSGGLTIRGHAYTSFFLTIPV